MAIINDQILQSAKSYNEAEVRFHIIDPTLRKLGYPGSDDVFLKLEDKLEYPFLHIGRRSKKDLPLGFPDYRVGLKGRRGSFIVEAKAGNVEVSRIDVEQAHSYAAHAQVGANFFILCDGTEFAIFETLSGPENKPIVALPIAEIDSRFYELENILSPTNLEKICQVKYDLALKLCDGLGSTARIHSGEYGMDNWVFRLFVNNVDQTEMFRALPQFVEMDKQLEMMANEFVLRVADGEAGRDSNGQIFAQVNFSGATKNSDASMKLLGIDRMKFSSNEKFLSCDKENPSIFESTADFAVAKGTMMPQFLGGAVQIEDTVVGDFFISARIYKDSNSLIGDYVAMANYRFGETQFSMELDFVGNFSLKLH